MPTKENFQLQIHVDFMLRPKKSKKNSKELVKGGLNEIYQSDFNYFNIIHLHVNHVHVIAYIDLFVYYLVIIILLNISKLYQKCMYIKALSVFSWAGKFTISPQHSIDDYCYHAGVL